MSDVGRASAWGAFWVGFGLLDYAADRHGHSLCTAVRWLFRTHTPIGRRTLTVSLVGGLVVLLRHLLKPLA